MSNTAIKYTNEFEDWLKSDQVIKVKGGYREQTSQYCRLFSKEELFTYFKKEFIS